MKICLKCFLDNECFFIGEIVCRVKQSVVHINFIVGDRKSVYSFCLITHKMAFQYQCGIV